MSEKEKYKIGFIAGIFDIFHIGHLDLLRKAKEQCEYLYVTVATDETTLRKKNHTPIIPYMERVEIVKAIKYVDEVVEEITLNKIEAFHKYHFDVLFAGEDHRNSPSYIETAKILNEYGVDIVFLSRIGTSSTKIHELIARRLFDYCE
jgi:glycerol-3-phosphate cytidylyltransferase